MTSQEKKEQLLKYREAEKESERLEQEIARWYSKAEKMTTIIKMVPGGGDGGRSIETAIEEVDALAGELAESRRKAVMGLTWSITECPKYIPDPPRKEVAF